MPKLTLGRAALRAAARPATLAGAGILIALASPAMAQDATTDTSAAASTSAPVVDTTTTQTTSSAMSSTSDHAFSGPWIGAVGGYERTRAGSNYDNAAYDQRRRNEDGFVYGGAIGFDHDFGRVVLGVEAEGMGSSAHRNYPDNAANPGYGLTRVTTGRDIYGGLRLGYKLSPNLLAYGKVGYTNAAYNLYTSDGTNSIKDRVHAQGYRAGAGLEYAMPHGMFVKTEYRFSDYGRTTYNIDPTAVNLDAVRHQVVGSVGLRF